MSPRRRAAAGLWVALTFAFAVLVHGVIHAVGSDRFVWDSPAHVVMLVGALGLLAGVGAQLGFGGPARERRRRIALVRAALEPRRTSTRVLNVAAQAAIAVLLFVPEGIALEPDRIVGAIVAGAVALLCSMLVFRAARDRVVALLIALVTTTPLARRRLATPRRAVRVAYASVPYQLFIPNRPPPTLAA